MMRRMDRRATLLTDQSAGRADLVRRLLQRPPIMKHVLIVDDEAQMRELLSLFLTQHGYEVSTAGSSTETLKLVQETQIDIEELDIRLANEDGLTRLST